ncbi:hypothetical protein JCM5296_004081 [Sporobolomyces johnsonii]
MDSLAGPTALVPPSSFPFFHFRPIDFDLSAPDDLSTAQIALAWLVYPDQVQPHWRKLVKLWRARREKARRGAATTRGDEPPFELVDLNWSIPSDLGFLDSAQLAALAFHPDYQPSMAEHARCIFQERRAPAAEPSPPPPAAVDPVVLSPLERPVSTLPRDYEAAPPIADLSITADEADDSAFLTAPASSDDEAESEPLSSATSGRAVGNQPLAAASLLSADSPDIPSIPSPLPRPLTTFSERSTCVQSSVLPLAQWMALGKQASKVERPTAVSFSWDPPTPQSLPAIDDDEMDNDTQSSSEDSLEGLPKSAAEVAKATESFLGGLQLGFALTAAFQPLRGTGDYGEADIQPTDSSADVDVKPEEAEDEPVTCERAPSGPISLLQRLSAASPPLHPSPSSSLPQSASASYQRAPLVPKHLVRTWSTFVAFGISNKIPLADAWRILSPPSLPQPVAIRLVRQKHKFCLCFVAYKSQADADKARTGLHGSTYGEKGQEIEIKTAEKPPHAYDWEWSLTSDAYRERYQDTGRSGHEQHHDEDNSHESKRRRLSPARSPSPPRPSTRRFRSPSPERRRRVPSAPPRSTPTLNDLVPAPLVSKLFSLFLTNLPSDLTRSQFLSNFRPKSSQSSSAASFVGFTLNDPSNPSYHRPGQHPRSCGSAFLLFDSPLSRKNWAQMHCAKRKFPGSGMTMWFEKENREERWRWGEMDEGWAEKHGGPRLGAMRDEERGGGRAGGGAGAGEGWEARGGTGGKRPRDDDRREQGKDTDEEQRARKAAWGMTGERRRQSSQASPSLQQPPAFPSPSHERPAAIPPPARSHFSPAPPRSPRYPESTSSSSYPPPSSVLPARRQRPTWSPEPEELPPPAPRAPLPPHRAPLPQQPAFVQQPSYYPPTHQHQHQYPSFSDYPQQQHARQSSYQAYGAPPPPPPPPPQQQWVTPRAPLPPAMNAYQFQQYGQGQMYGSAPPPPGQQQAYYGR